jgi:peptide/nickel transport system permease protein
MKEAAAKTEREFVPEKAEPIRSPSRIFIGRLLRNRVALTGGGILIVLYLMAIFGSFIGPYDPLLSQVEFPDHPPTKVRFVDANGTFHARPFITGAS